MLPNKSLLELVSKCAGETLIIISAYFASTTEWVQEHDQLVSRIRLCSKQPVSNAVILWPITFIKIDNIKSHK